MNKSIFARLGAVVFFVFALVFPVTAKPSALDPRAYLSLVLNVGDEVIPTATPVPVVVVPTLSPTATRVLPTATPVIAATSTPLPSRPPGVSNCSADPNASLAPNFPIKIHSIDKVAETVTLRNISGVSVNVANWRICSITGNQLHATLSGSIGAGVTVVINSQAGGNIWNNSSRDDGALYDELGRLVSYLVN